MPNEFERETRVRQRNVTIDWEGVDAEKRRRLRNARGSAKRGLTMALRQASEAMLAERSKGEAEQSEKKLNEAFKVFTEACD